MGRLLNWPLGVGIRSRRPLAGPRTAGAVNRQETIGGRAQTVSSPFGGWKYEFVLPPATGRAYRRIEGLVTALHGGANAVRVSWPTPDGLSFKEAGTNVTPYQERFGMPWSNGKPWANGLNWKITLPNVSVAGSAARGDTIVRLGSAFWGHSLDMGDEVGFFPFHFGKYVITESQGAGVYRIWPPLRKAVMDTDLATLNPVLVMTLDGEQSADLMRGVGYGEETTLVMSEVYDYDVRDYFGD